MRHVPGQLTFLPGGRIELLLARAHIVRSACEARYEQPAGDAKRKKCTPSRDNLAARCRSNEGHDHLLPCRPLSCIRATLFYRSRPPEAQLLVIFLAILSAIFVAAPRPRVPAAAPRQLR